ncbi:MAG: 7-carboxy-7-deazaguanine synthase QueE [Thermoplasmata archaeon]
MEISEIFYSIQGEGREIGRPTVFIRTAGCNMRCEWCDTSYAWTRGDAMGVNEIMKKVDEYPVKRFCITGGEPLLQKDTIGLVERLKTEGEVSLETNGSLDITPFISEGVMISMDYKTPSSGMSSKVRRKNLDLLGRKDQLKFVIANFDDYDFALNVIEEKEIHAEIVFQPEGGTQLKMLADRVIKDGVDVGVLPQLHKLIWGEKEVFRSVRP